MHSLFWFLMKNRMFTVTLYNRVWAYNARCTIQNCEILNVTPIKNFPLIITV